MNHSQAAALNPAELRMYRGTFWLLIVAELLIFVTLFASRFLYTGLERVGLSLLVLGITVLFLASAFFVRRAVRAIAQGQAAVMTANLGLTSLLGLLALLGIFYDGASIGLPVGTALGGFYYVTEGVHALHVLIGLTALAALRSSGQRGRFSPQNYWVVEAGALFWYFVVVVWLGFVVVFYLL